MSADGADRQDAERFRTLFELVADGAVLLFPPTLSALLIAESVTAWGSSPLLVFLGTLALSAAAFLFALALMHVPQIPGWLLAILGAVACIIAGSLARAVGQEAPDAVALPPLTSPTAAGAYALEYLVACWNIFQPVGFLLAIASGWYLAWRASRLAARLS